MTLFVRFDKDTKNNRSYKNIMTFLCNVQEVRAYEGQEFEVLTIMARDEKSWFNINDVLDFEVM